MRDNKVRLSADVLEKAALIAAEWGLKNTRAAVEAVFRCYADEYRSRQSRPLQQHLGAPPWPPAEPAAAPTPISCEALDALDDLLGASS
ncbi:MAG TPA: hypothetical protein IGS37_11430 [Synechococcales cyanobacterium M55_K2018_004]|nr:hypothetical protein [Synechococcales cyanobacterium M55_K2018_004]